MTPWVDDYLVALLERDKHEKAEQGLYDKYTRLADRVATLHSAATEYHNDVEDRKPDTTDKQKSADSRFQQPVCRDNHALQKTLQDLGEAQRSKSAMELRLQQLADQTKKLSIQAEIDAKRISDLTIEKAHIFSRMRDRDEELKGKAKLLEDVHDETVSLTLQLNMAIEQSHVLKKENKELVDRWMARVGEEADAMNRASRFS